MQDQPHSICHKPSRRSAIRRFTVVELVLVLAILGLLATVVITKIGGIFEDSQEKTAQFHVNQTFKTPLFKYRVDMGAYPSTSEGLQVLITPPADRQHLWKGPYADSIPNDPWQTPYQYAFPGTVNSRDYDLRSAGPDRQFDTADDIGNWKKTKP
jgi:general secretion pathway protein G